jgi:hypothetical protein
MKCKLDSTVVDEAIRFVYPNRNEKKANVFGTKTFIFNADLEIIIFSNL